MWPDDDDDDDTTNYLNDDFDLVEADIETLDMLCLDNDEERHFVDDVNRRLYEYGRRTILTHAQRKCIDQLMEKYV